MTAALVGYAVAQQTGPNGGLVAGPKGAHQTELLPSPSEMTVYLLDQGKVHDTKGTKARAVIQQDGKTTTVNLADQQGKKLVGKLDAPVEKGAIVVITGKDHHGDPISSRYNIK